MLESIHMALGNVSSPCFGRAAIHENAANRSFTCVALSILSGIADPTVALQGQHE